MRVAGMGPKETARIWGSADAGHKARGRDGAFVTWPMECRIGSCIPLQVPRGRREILQAEGSAGGPTFQRYWARARVQGRGG